MTWELDPELRALGHRYVAPRETEHPYDAKRRDDGPEGERYVRRDR